MKDPGWPPPLPEGERPSWRHPLLRWRWHAADRCWRRYLVESERYERWHAAKHSQSRAPIIDPTSELLASKLKARQQRHERETSEALDAMCLEADVDNGFPLWSVLRIAERQFGEVLLDRGELHLVIQRQNEEIAELRNKLLDQEMRSKGVIK